MNEAYYNEIDPKAAAWFWCSAHKESHTGNHCPKGTRETCFDVGPYSTKEVADDFPANRGNDQEP